MRVLPYAGALRCGGLAGPRTSSTRANIFAGHTCTCRRAVRHQTEAWRGVAFAHAVRRRVCRWSTPARVACRTFCIAHKCTVLLTPLLRMSALAYLCACMRARCSARTSSSSTRPQFICCICWMISDDCSLFLPPANMLYVVITMDALAAACYVPAHCNMFATDTAARSHSARQQ